MRKKHHKLLAAVIVMVAIAAGTVSISEAGGIRWFSTSTNRVYKPGAKTASGEPDDGGGTGKTGNGNTSGGIVVPTPNGFVFILPTWVTRYWGVGW